VQDYGKGMSPKKFEQVFNRFYRGDEFSTIPGTGLSLAIARTLVDGIGGIEMESEPGKGSTVILSLHAAVHLRPKR